MQRNVIMDEKTIKETLLKGERITLECKKAQSNVPVDADLMLNSVLKPELVEQRNLMQVKLILSIETKDVVKDVVKELSERQKIILDFIAENPTLTAKAISEKISEKTSEKFDVTERTVENDLAKLKKLGILIREGSRKEGKWVIKVNKRN